LKASGGHLHWFFKNCHGLLASVVPATNNSALHPYGVAKSSTSLNWLRERQECHLCRVAGNTM